jgi:hypothetical protein
MKAGFSKKEFVALMAALMAVGALAIDIMLPALPRSAMRSPGRQSQRPLAAVYLGFCLRN